MFDRKMNEVTNVVMEKARLVVQGFMQIPGVDYDEVYSAVAMLKSFRILMALWVLLLQNWTSKMPMSRPR